MTVLATICEYNPFHRGHAYHLEKARELAGADAVLCLMSGSAVQRGEPAVFDKWSRARMALTAGADIVIELPVVYALSSAGRFASGAVGLLERMGCVTHLTFGVEAGDPQVLRDLASLLSDPPDAWHQNIRDALSRGASYPSARLAATRALLEHRGLYRLACDAERVMFSPNNILALEYLAALERSHSGITPVFVVRQGAGYHDSEPVHLASATAVRQALISGDIGLVRSMVPEEVFEIIEEQVGRGRGPVKPQQLDSLVLYALRNKTTSQLSACPDMEPGLPLRFAREAGRAGTREELRRAVKSKRYTMSRIDRIMMYALLGLTADDITQSPQYMRLLAFSSSFTRILLDMKKKTNLLIINRLRPSLDALHLTDPQSARCLELDIAATDLQALLFPSPTERAAGQDFTHSPVRL